jgi:hypothetical protein
LAEILKFSRRRKPLISKATQPFVRLQTFLFLYLGPLLIACAYQGTIVEKAGRPLPFAYSLGIDASFKFALRDHLGRVRWQLVSAEVFNSYQVGDYFDDESPMPLLFDGWKGSGANLGSRARNHSNSRPAFSADPVGATRGLEAESRCFCAWSLKQSLMQ